MSIENGKKAVGDLRLQTSRRDFLKTTGSALAVTALGSALAEEGATAAPAVPVVPATSVSAMSEWPDRVPPGFNILFILTDKERYFDQWPFPVPSRESLKKKGITFTNHQIASCVCSPSRSTIYTGRHIQHTGVFDNISAPWQPTYP